MECRNHPEVAASDRCAGCAEAFCNNCLVEVGGQKYCNSCKVLAIQGQPITLEEATIPCPQAREALMYAIFGLFCCGMILGPIAIFKGISAKKEINADPRLTGSGKANAAIAVGIIGLVLWGFGLLSKASHTQ